MPNLHAALRASRDHCGQKKANQGFYNAVQEATAQQLRRQALGTAGTMGVLGLGLGAGGRGLLGLLQLAQSNARKPQSTVPQPLAIDLPLEEHALEEEKFAGIGDFLAGDYAETVSGVPWAMPAGIAAAAGGTYGGWKLMDYVLDKRRKAQLQEEMNKAKSDYEMALSGGGAMKMSQEGSLAADLDKLYDEVEKKANYLSDVAGYGTGLYGVYAGSTGLIGALAAYNMGKKRQRRSLIERALKERRRKRFNAQPSALYLRPGTISGPNPPSVPPSAQTAPPAEEAEGLNL